MSRAPTKFATGQVAVGTTAVLVVAARESRSKLKLAPGGQVWIGHDSGVTVSNGWLITVEEIETGSAVYAIASGGDRSIAFYETYD